VTKLDVEQEANGINPLVCEVPAVAKKLSIKK
jgi:hypothetical protein